MLLTDTASFRHIHTCFGYSSGWDSTLRSGWVSNWSQNQNLTVVGPGEIDCRCHSRAANYFVQTVGACSTAVGHAAVFVDATGVSTPTARWYASQYWWPMSVA